MNHALARLPRFQFANGDEFVSEHCDDPDVSPFDAMEPPELVSLIAALWRDAYEAKRPETSRLSLNSHYYDGFHYRDAWLNRTNPVENHIYAIVETLVSNTIAVKPRPEIVPEYGFSMDDELADRLQGYAASVMNTTRFDEAVELGARDKYIYGWNWWMVSFDYRTGMPYAVPRSVFSLYPDPAARNEDDAMYIQIADAVSTARLRATFPKAADRIHPDNKATPAYNAVIRPWFEFLGDAHEIGHPTIADSAMVVHAEGAQPTEGTSLVFSEGDRMEHGTTTFVISTLIRDDAMVAATYYGTKRRRRPDGGFDEINAQKYSSPVPRCASGWWLVTMTSYGLFLEPPRKLDDCYLGLPLVMDRCERRTDRFWSRSPIDHIIPINRGLNRDNALIDRGTDLALNPPLLTDSNSGLARQLNGGTVAGGDLLELSRGSDAKYLAFPGPASQIFARTSERRKSMRDVSMVQDSLSGARPPGIEAAAALRRLDENSLRVVKAKEQSANRARALLLRKLMKGAGRKLQRDIAFLAAHGDMEVLTSREIDTPFNIDFAVDTGTIEGRRDLEDKAFALFGAGAIDRAALLDSYRWPGRTKIELRMQMAEQNAMLMQAGAEAGRGAKESASRLGSTNTNGRA